MKKFFCVVLLLLFASSCHSPRSDGYRSVNIYYPLKNPDTDSALIRAHTESLKTGGDEITRVFELLKSAPKNNSLISPLPQDLKLLSAKIDNGIADIDLSGQYNYLSGLNKTLADACITLSMCQLEGVSSVRITVDGVGTGSLYTPPDFIRGRLGLINYENSLVLYFISRDDTALIPEIRHTVARENESVLELIVKYLMDGSVTQTNKPVFPRGTRLLSVYSEQNICYLNLSKEFITNHDISEQSELLTIYAIVNSLTELPDIDCVQFLIEGVKLRGFTYFDLSAPIERNLEI